MTTPLFFVASPRNASPTLFPYTTLFRSQALFALRRGRRLGRGARISQRRVPCAAPAPPRSRAAAPRSARSLGDRKSTRLNSSHGYISYAVFRLKKKTPPLGMTTPLDLGASARNDNAALLRRVPSECQPYTLSLHDALPISSSVCASAREAPGARRANIATPGPVRGASAAGFTRSGAQIRSLVGRSEEHTSELQSRLHLVCRLPLEKKNASARNDNAARPRRLRSE